MRLLTVNLARSIWLFNTADLNPRGLDLRPILEAVRIRYAFEKSPSSEDLRNTTKYPEFVNGGFVLDDGQQIQIQKLTIFDDGLVVETRSSTSAGDSFLADLTTFAVNDFKLSADPLAKARKLYVSEIEVTTDVTLDVYNEKFKKFSALLSETSQRDYQPFGCKIGTDPTPPGTPVMFAFERKAGTPFNQNRYWSTSPFSTERHLELLDRLAKILAE